MLAIALVLVIQPRYDAGIWRVVRLDALLGIVITGLVFAIVLKLADVKLPSLLRSEPAARQ